MSNRTVQPQPNQFQYPITILQVFPVLSRPAPLAPDPYPVFDPSQVCGPFVGAIKLWSDSDPAKPDGQPAADSDLVTYTTWDFSALAFVKIQMTGAQAKAFNIPGGHQAAYDVPATPATQNGSALNRFLFSNLQQANDLAALVVGAFVVEDPNRPEYGAEQRRIYNILTPYRDPQTGQSPINNVGLLLQQSAPPGHWDPAALMRGQYIYVASSTGGTAYGAKTIDVPCRDLFPNTEKLVIIPAGSSPDTLFSARAVIQRLDMPDPNAPANGGAGLSPAQATQIAQTLNLANGMNDALQRLLVKFNA